MDISAFRSVQGSTGFVEQRQSAPTEAKTSGTVPFFGKIVALFSNSDQNKAIKAEFLNSLEKAYGPDFRNLVESRVNPDSGKPLERRVVRDLIQQGDKLNHERDMQRLGQREPTQTFVLGAPGREVRLTGCVHTERSEISEGAKRFIDNNGVKHGGSNIIRDIGLIFNGSPIMGTRVHPSRELERSWEFFDNHGFEGVALLQAFTKGPNFDDVGEALNAIHELGDTDKPNPLTRAYLDHFGLETLPNDTNHTVHKDPQRIATNFSQFFGQIELSLKNLESFATNGERSGFLNQAREMVHVTQDTIERFRLGAQILSNPDFLESVPPEHRDTMRALGEQYKTMYEMMTDPKGRFQEMLSFAAECIDNPIDFMNMLRGPDQDKLFDVDPPKDMPPPRPGIDQEQTPPPPKDLPPPPPHLDQEQTPPPPNDLPPPPVGQGPTPEPYSPQMPNRPPPPPPNYPRNST